MLELTGKISDVSIGLDGKVHLTLDINEEETIKQNYDKYKNYSLIDICIQQHKEAKSKAANAYFHVLVAKIAKALTVPIAQAKNMLVCRYGQPELSEDGSPLAYKSAAPLDYIMTHGGIHATPIGSDGEQTIYAIYRSVGTYSKDEMAQLIDGTVSDAIQLGIDVLPTCKINDMKKNWQPPSVIR